MLDDSRKDVSTGPREFMVSVFYPGVPDPEAQRARLGDIFEPAPEAAITALSEAAGFSQQRLVELCQAAGFRAFRDLELAPGGPYPVLIYYPGGQSHRLANAGLCEGLAAAGYAVFCLDAPRDAPITVFPSGQVVVGPLPEDEDYIWPRVKDVQFLLDQLSGLPFADRLDLARIGMFGHSRGGYLSNICAVEDPRISAALNMDGFLWGLWCEGTGLDQYPAEFQERVRACRTPILRLRGEQASREAASANFEEEARDFGGNFVYVEFEGFQHNSFSPMPLLCGQPAKWRSFEYLQDGIDPHNFARLLGVMREFFDATLREPRPLATLFANRNKLNVFFRER